jgi:hypothetical protein
MTDELFEQRRKKLEEKIQCAVLDLFDHIGAGAFKLPIPFTSPPLYIVVGAEEDIKNLIE